MSIKPLSKETIKLINSTQVISSIYSAIKELVENSLDAEAQSIEVNLVDNGLSLIEVKDNGIGICREDAQYMALPSYTSKIKDFNDLELLTTYGFRGEGLTAICQVSDVTICTKTTNDETMICYKLDNEGRIISSDISHGLTGTIVQMRNLFRNMPVRRNILNNKKRINQELKAVELLLKSYAICQPSIRFMLRVNSNTVFTKPSCKNITEAMKSVLGMQLFSKLTFIKKLCSDVEFQLFIPKKEVKDCTEVSQNGLQFLYVNNRPIKSKEIEKKINKRLSEYFNPNTSNSRKYIFCIILKVNPGKLDINLEPNKDKVFLQNEPEILEQIDTSLLSFYELQNSQSSTQNDIENMNVNENINELQITKTVEKEWPACKKRKIDIQTENISCTRVNDKNLLNEKHSTDKPVKKSDSDFLNSIKDPILSDSDSNDGDDLIKRRFNNTDNVNEKTSKQNTESDDSELFNFGKDIPMKNRIIEEETLSQLPKVDLGEDFDLEEIISKSKRLFTSDSEKNEVNSTNDYSTNIKWSKGQVPGLQGGVTIGIQNNVNSTNCGKELTENQEYQQESESFDFQENTNKINNSEDLISTENMSIVEHNEFDWEVNLKKPIKRSITKNNDKSPVTLKRPKKLNSVDQSQKKIPFAGDNACLTFMGPSAFAMYCATARSKIVRQHPELSPAEVAVYMNKQWKEMCSEEREYYRDLACKHNESTSQPSTSQASKKVKSQPSQAEKDKNKKQLLNALGNMKTNKTEVKNESMIMRTYAPWNINLSVLTEKFRRPVNKLERAIVGSLNSILWILKLRADLFVFDITELHAQLNVENFDINKISTEYVKNIVDRWFVEKNEMNIFHPLHSIKE